MKGWTRRTGVRNKDAVGEGVKKKARRAIVTVFLFFLLVFITLFYFFVHEHLHLLVCKIVTGDGTITWNFSTPPFTSCPDIERASAFVYFIVAVIPYITDLLLVSAIFLISRRYPTNPTATAYFVFPPFLNTLSTIIYFPSNQVSPYNDFRAILAHSGWGWFAISCIFALATILLSISLLSGCVRRSRSTSQKGH
jgi:uncharacterized membrane protein